MKKILLLASSIITALSVNSQTLTQANNAYTSGDTYSTYQCDSTGITPGANGAGVTWNYSSLIAHTSIQTDYNASVSTNTTYSPADVMVSAGLSNSAYFKSSVNDLKYYGGNIGLNGNSANIIYTSPAIFAKYPMSLNTTTTSATAGTISVTSPFPLSGAFTGTCVANAAASGTLALPTRTFSNVLRVTNSQTISATSLGATVNLIVTDFYSPSDSKAPILTINSSTISSGFGSNVQTIVTVLKDYITVGINENNRKSIELSLFPNPASSVINFSTQSNEAHKVLAYDITGKQVALEFLNEGKAKMNVSTLSDGMYLYSILGKDNQVLTSGKFNVSK